MNKTRLFTYCLCLIAPLFLASVNAEEKTSPRSSEAANAKTAEAAEKPINALLITGGCCHNYEFQSKALTNGINMLAKINWTVVNEGGKGTHAEIDFYKNADWAAPYDVVVHNECFAKTDNPEYIKRISDGHKSGKPAVVIHCAMHTYRDAKVDDWRKFLGVTSRHHEHQSNYKVAVKVPEHPIMAGFPSDWVTPKDELYVIEKLWPKATALATSQSEKTQKDHPVIWVNNYGGARVFGTTYGHSDDTFRDPVFLNVVGRGLLWSIDRLEP